MKYCPTLQKRWMRVRAIFNLSTISISPHSAEKEIINS